MKAFIIFMVHCHPRMLRVLLLMFCFFISFATSRDTITSSQFIKEPETLTSNNGMFNLGFFTPQNSTFTYLGIWYESKSSVVWIANRNQPLRDSSGILNISEDGNLVLLNGQKLVIWTTNVSDIASGTSAQLQDSGNLALVEGTTGGTVWESFQHPSDTLLPKMKLISHKNSGERVKLTSWKSPSDPSVGDFSVSLESLSIPEVLVWNGSHPYWRSGPWNSQVFLGIPNMKNIYLDGFQFAEEEQGTYYLTYTYANSSVLELTIFVISSQGKLEQKGWDHEKEEWEVEWTSQESECDIYGTCGAFGSCNSKSSPICSCLRGFEPRNPEEWNRQNWTSGCVRRELLQCERVKNGSEAGKNDGFLKLQKMKVPYFAQWTDSEVSCRIQCLNNCSCVAYAYDAGIGCMLWSGNLIDIQSFGFGGTDLYIRVAYSELDKKRNVILIITVTVIIGTILIVTCGYFLWKWATRREKRHDIILGRSKIGDLNQVELQDISLYDFEQLAAATNNFHQVNKLGQGGFGPVYKGTLESGQEIAVKRLSRASGQGLEEFMNEVVVISKLQHRNLVKLLGCCTEGDEKMLIYEYMPNKSLESYIFDSLKQNVLLDWKKRFNILEGIARGLLYLHRDSRLRIIHRDLKLSNILLDNDLNPKISDFGMARIFEHNVDEVNTRRIVGTFGYISPEYAMEGLFSEKSDVFSFGVLLLEIISGKKNTSFCEYSEALSLLGFAWKLWNDGNIASLIDPEIYDPRFLEDIARCIHMGLLCVQELARDRPTMTTIISMLNSETVNLPPPRQPAFTHRQTLLDAESSQKSDGLFSINYVSVTNIKGR